MKFDTFLDDQHAPTRPALRWHGGKWRLAPWILSHFPSHRVYVEPYGGAASVLLRKPRSYAEVYNDLDEDVVNFFRVLRDETLRIELLRAIELTPFARGEFEDAYEPADGVERARRLAVRAFMGFGSDGHNVAFKTGFRTDSNRSGTTPAHDWASLPTALSLVGQRLRAVVIERRPAIDVMTRQDGLETLHYVDPPYLPAVRSQKSRRGGLVHHAYAHEMDQADHVTLLSALRNLQGMVVLSGYTHPLYEDALHDWRRVERKAFADGARERTEVLWINPVASLFS